MTISSYTSDRTAVNAASRDPFQRELLKRAIQLAYEEDFGAGHPIDLTTQAVAGPQLKANAVIYCKQSGVYVSGLSILGDVFRYLEPKTEIELLIEDGAYIDKAPYPVARISGYAFAVLGAERIALNLLQRMSGITTMTRQFVERAAGHGIAILDTRKTTPGLRVFERYAVIVGGGVNHRFGLNEKILLKDNHIQIAGGVAGAIKAVRKAYPDSEIEVECANLNQVEESLTEKVEKVMLDNMTADMVRDAVALINGRTYVEVSGGITLDNIADYLIPGVDAISIGALTHSVKSVDLSLEVEGYL